jgi:mono/diheme cytochrome c family protein
MATAGKTATALVSPTPVGLTKAPSVASPTAGATDQRPTAIPGATATEVALVLSKEQPPSPAPADPTVRVAAPTATATQTLTATATAIEPSPTAQPVADEKLVATGLQVYKEQYCGLCHQLGAAGTAGLFGPTHDGLGLTAAARINEQGYGGMATTAEEYIRESIVDPKRFIVPGYGITSHPMPAYDFLSEEQIMALVQMLLAQQ